MATKFKQDINVIGTLSATTLSGDGSALTGVGGDITIQEEGSPLATAATTLNFVGAGVTASGTGATKTITIAGGGTSYANSDVDTHLNTGTATSNQVLSWTGTDYDWVAQSGGASLGDLSVSGSTMSSSGTTITLNDNVTVTGTITSSGAGTPTLTSSTDINLQAGTGAEDRVEIMQAPLKIASFSTTDRDAKTSEDGDLIYNSTTNTVDAYINGSWSSLGVYAGSGITSVAADTTPQLGGDLDGQTYNITTTGKILFSNVYSAEGDLPSATTYHGMFAHVHATGAGYFAHGGAWIKLANDSQLSSYQTTAGLNSSIDTHLNQSSAGTNEVLSWDGADYAWVSNAGGGGGTPGGSTTQVQFNDSGSFGGDAEFTYNSTSNALTVGSVITDSLTTATTGTPTITSASNIVLNPTGAVVVQSGGLRLANMDTTARNALTASNGDMIYNTTVNKIQAYQNGAWINLEDGSSA